MKIIFMGSAAFAVPSLDSLQKAGHTVSLVVTQPDKPAGRGLKMQPCAVAAFAHLENLPLFQPERIKDDAVIKRLKKLEPELIVVVAYGKMIPDAILFLPILGAVNVHASLLPKYRGAAPINWAIVKGEKKTGVTTMFMNSRMDAGDILMQKATNIKAEETASELYDRLSVMGADLLTETLTRLEEQKLKPSVQDESKVSYAPIIKKEDGLIDWNRAAEEISNLIRGMQPWPVAYTFLNGKMLKIFKATVHPLPHPPPSRGRETGEEVEPGTIVETGKNLAVATGNGTLYLTDIQLEGKKRMEAEAFLRGHRINVGSRFSTSLEQ